MIDNYNVLALVAARGGSKTFPNKNLALLGGQSLLARAVRTARACRHVDRVVVSSDSNELLLEGRNAGAETPFQRPAEFATDQATTASVMLHALSTLSPLPDYFVLLQPTTPLRTPDDVDACIETCVRSGARACVSVVESPKSPFLMYWRTDDGALSPVIDRRDRPSRRQDYQPVYLLNGAVYVGRVSDFLVDPLFAPPGCLSVVMPPERSIDIDTVEDLRKAEECLL
jgi:CMP-N-acetylneuraminic acid synthetase